MFEFMVRNRQIILMISLIVAAGGAAAWMKLPIDAFPDATNQQVMILSEADGLGPDDVEQQVTIPIEITMGGLPGVRLVRSMSKTALSQVVVVFEDSMDTYLARQLVSERLTMAAADLPEGVVPELG
ncbi:MAG TPA: efflux RND transporter permease subunit, partial [Myxococcota bacterium]|nr:efflux RND transporter permease subunit [Myxococcota bacterium]